MNLAQEPQSGQRMKPWMIEAGISTLKEYHPLYEAIEWRDIMPCFVCGRKRQKRQTFEEKQSLILPPRWQGQQRGKDADADSDGEEDSVQDDQYRLFKKAGYGPNAYFDIQMSLIRMLTWISLFLLPVLYINFCTGQ